MTARTVVTWAIVLISVAAILVLQALSGRNHPLAPVDVAKTPSLELKLMGRYVLGVKRLLPTQPAGQFMDQIDRMAQSPVDELRAIPLRAELMGRDNALEALDQFEKTSHSQGLDKDAAILRDIYGDAPGDVTQEQRDRLVERHEWFGKLAISYGLPPDDPARQAAMNPATRAFVGLLAAGGIGIMALLAGVVLLIVTVVRLAGGLRLAFGIERLVGRPVHAGLPPLPSEPVTRLPPRGKSIGAFLEAFAIYMAGFLVMLVGISLAARALHFEPGLGSSWLLILVVAAALAWPRLRGLSWGEMRVALGWHTGRGVFREIGAGIVGYLAGLPLLALSLLVVLILAQFAGRNASHPVQNDITGSFWNCVLLYSLVSIWAPITEETLFRGALYHHVRQRFGWIISAASVAVIFAAVHPQGWLGWAPLATVGFILAGLREWRGSLIASMTAHALHNAFIMTLVLVVMT